MAVFDKTSKEIVWAEPKPSQTPNRNGAKKIRILGDKLYLIDRSALYVYELDESYGD